jgi:hypothetical protein
MAIRFHKWISQAGFSVGVCACLLIHANAVEAQNRHPQANGEKHQSCPVTKAAAAFVPPSPYKNTASSGSFFFGTPKLWTLVHPNSWTGQKLVWWSPENDQNSSTSPELTVCSSGWMRLPHSGRPIMRIGDLSTANPLSSRLDSIRLPTPAVGRLPGGWAAKK